MARKYPEFFQDENIIWRKTFYSDIGQTTPVDPGQVIFKIKSPSGVTTQPTVTDEAGIGNFSAQKLVNEYGRWAWRWMATNPVIVDQGFIDVVERNVT